MRAECKSLVLKPIGYIHNSRKLKFDAPHQPEQSVLEENYLELLPKFNFEQALSDLHGFSYIWLLWWFDRNKTWKPMVLPPRGEQKRRGLFATRSPHRPNPIGITAVKLVKIQKRRVYIGANDLLDGTAILDIKPYLKSVDSFPDASGGWIDEVEDAYKSSLMYTIAYDKLAQEQKIWLESRGLKFLQKAEKILSFDPRPHRTRRICKLKDGTYRIGCGAWRVYFLIDKKRVNILKITPGYPMASLKSDSDSNIAYRKEQLSFYRKWK